MNALLDSSEKIVDQIVSSTVSSKAIAEEIDHVLNNKTYSAKSKAFLASSVENLKENMLNSVQQCCKDMEVNENQESVLEEEEMSIDEEYSANLIEHRKMLESILKVEKQELENESSILRKKLQNLQ
uniref:Uncharacterized protein n=1 Tax=Panagrolaimus sp. JU765 TaxID=591449 RepID=A0AC34QB08_9BILA